MLNAAIDDVSVTRTFDHISTQLIGLMMLRSAVVAINVCTTWHVV